jgi:hypothetical protein
MEEVIKQQEITETGTDSSGLNRQSKEWQRQSVTFETTQGLRRRHPDQVLSNYATIAQTNDSPHTTWEKAIAEENELTMMPKVYQTQGQLSAVQLGLVQTAEKNYQKSKNKLSTMYMASI